VGGVTRVAARALQRREPLELKETPHPAAPHHPL
jgi:hypothetical protein